MLPPLGFKKIKTYNTTVPDVIKERNKQKTTVPAVVACSPFGVTQKKKHNTTVPGVGTWPSALVLGLRVDVDRVDLEQPPDDVDVAVGRGAMEGGPPGAQRGRIHTKRAACRRKRDINK